jgi:hypothetical protein
MAKLHEKTHDRLCAHVEHSLQNAVNPHYDGQNVAGHLVFK